jgi:para-nitrobenzyl esterase
MSISGMRDLNSFLLALSLGLLSNGALAAPDQVTIDTGRLQGRSEDGVVAFKGIPFAQPPAGDLRWRAPQPAVPWTGVRSAVAYGPDCMQVPVPGDAAPPSTHLSEDCLSVNVWAPAKESTKDKLPVMVWIYGGGFVNGGTSPAVYDGSQFAKRGVILVSINYRVGRFGFFAHPALTRESPSPGQLGNYAFLDQIAGLQWVKRNIGAFGGDSNNVTIFGESAGGFSVHVLLATPAARGLFQKAIVESGGGGRNMLPAKHLHTTEAGDTSCEQLGVQFAKSMGVKDEGPAGLAALRKLPAEAIRGDLNMVTMMTGRAPTYCGPMLGGAGLLEEPAVVYAAGNGAKVPVIIGANSSDSFFMGGTLEQILAPFGADRDKALAIYDPQHTANVQDIGTKSVADMGMIEPARSGARIMTSKGQPVYLYRFSYVAESMRKQWPGAPHASEIPFVFDTVAERYGKDLTAQDSAAARITNAYWIAFAKTGTPEVQGQPKWPVYSPQNDVIMNFTPTGPVAGPDPWKERLDLAETANAHKGQSTAQGK